MNLPDSVRAFIVGPRHVGVVTEDLAATLARLQQLFGLRDDEIVRVESAETCFAFATLGGQPLEFIEPRSARFRDILLRSNLGVNHVCFTVRDLDGAVATMAAHGVRSGHVTPEGIIEMPHARMVYFDPADTAGLLIEFVEPRT